MTRHQTPFIRALAIVALLIAAFAATGTAGAATPCSKAILDDWLDNDRIDRIYELPCYEAAIDAIPEDIRIYTNAEEVISRAFQSVSGKRLERQLQGPSGVESTPPDVAPAVELLRVHGVPAATPRSRRDVRRAARGRWPRVRPAASPRGLSTASERTARVYTRWPDGHDRIDVDSVLVA